jgi:hypothetical protein
MRWIKPRQHRLIRRGEISVSRLLTATWYGIVVFAGMSLLFLLFLRIGLRADSAVCLVLVDCMAVIVSYLMCNTRVSGRFLQQELITEYAPLRLLEWTLSSGVFIVATVFVSFVTDRVLTDLGIPDESWCPMTCALTLVCLCIAITWIDRPKGGAKNSPNETLSGPDLGVDPSSNPGASGP